VGNLLEEGLAARDAKWSASEINVDECTRTVIRTASAMMICLFSGGWQRHRSKTNAPGCSVFQCAQQKQTQCARRLERESLGFEVLSINLDTEIKKFDSLLISPLLVVSFSCCDWWKRACLCKLFSSIQAVQVLKAKVSITPVYALSRLKSKCSGKTESSRVNKGLTGRQRFDKRVY